MTYVSSGRVACRYFVTSWFVTARRRAIARPIDQAWRATPQTEEKKATNLPYAEVPMAMRECSRSPND